MNILTITLKDLAQEILNFDGEDNESLNNGDTLHLHHEINGVMYRLKVKIQLEIPETQKNELILQVPFISVWDGGVEVQTECTVNCRTGEIQNIEKSNVRGMAYVRGLDVCEEQYIIMNDSRVYVYENESGFDYWADLNNELI
jgi:hypothetical protein